MGIMGNNLQKILRERGIRLDDLAEMTGISISQISRIQAGKRGLTLENAIKISNALSVEIRELTDEFSPADMVAVSNLSLNEKKTSLTLYKASDIQIPQYSADDVSVSMGHGFEFPDRADVIRFWRVSRAWAFNNIPANSGYHNLRIMTGIGDSMLPLFNDGDLLLIDAGVRTMDREGVFYFRVDNEGYIKRLQRIPSSKGLIIRALSLMTIWILLYWGAFLKYGVDAMFDLRCGQLAFFCNLGCYSHAQSFHHC